MQEQKEKLITPEKRRLNVCSKGLRDFRRLREQLAKQQPLRCEELKDIDHHGR